MTTVDTQVPVVEETSADTVEIHVNSESVRELMYALSLQGIEVNASVGNHDFTTVTVPADEESFAVALLDDIESYSATSYVRASILNRVPALCGELKIELKNVEPVFSIFGKTFVYRLEVKGHQRKMSSFYSRLKG